LYYKSGISTPPVLLSTLKKQAGEVKKMKKIMFAILAASFMVLLTFGAMSASAEATGTIYGTVYGVIENDWGENTYITLANVPVTITCSDGESRTVFTDSHGYYSHTVNFERKTYTISTATVKGIPVGDKKYTFYGDSEHVRVNLWNRPFGKKVDICMHGEETQAKAMNKIPRVLSKSNLNRIMLINTLRGILQTFSNRMTLTL